jgi:hypothetical protein
MMHTQIDEIRREAEAFILNDAAALNAGLTPNYTR